MAVRLVEKQMVGGLLVLGGEVPRTDDFTERVLVAHGKAEFIIEAVQAELNLEGE